MIVYRMMTCLKLKLKCQSFIDSKTKQRMVNVYYVRKLNQKNRIFIFLILEKLITKTEFSIKGHHQKFMDKKNSEVLDKQFENTS